MIKKRPENDHDQEIASLYCQKQTKNRCLTYSKQTHKMTALKINLLKSIDIYSLI